MASLKQREGMTLRCYKQRLITGTTTVSQLPWRGRIITGTFQQVPLIIRGLINYTGSANDEFWKTRNVALYFKEEEDVLNNICLKKKSSLGRLICYNTHHIVVLNGELISKISIHHMKSHAEEKNNLYLSVRMITKHFPTSNEIRSKDTEFWFSVASFLLRWQPGMHQKAPRVNFDCTCLWII